MVARYSADFELLVEMSGDGEDVGLLPAGVALGEVVAVVDEGRWRAGAVGSESGVLLHTLAGL